MSQVCSCHEYVPLMLLHYLPLVSQVCSCHAQSVPLMPCVAGVLMFLFEFFEDQVTLPRAPTTSAPTTTSPCASRDSRRDDKAGTRAALCRDCTGQPPARLPGAPTRPTR